MVHESLFQDLVSIPVLRFLLNIPKLIRECCRYHLPPVLGALAHVDGWKRVVSVIEALDSELLTRNIYG
jgi:hypothetical protein